MDTPPARVLIQPGSAHPSSTIPQSPSERRPVHVPEVSVTQMNAGNGRAFRSLTARGGGFVLDQEQPELPVTVHPSRPDGLASFTPARKDLADPEVSSPLLFSGATPAAASRRSRIVSLSRLIFTMSGRNKSAKVQSLMMRSRRLQPGIWSR